MLYFLHLENSIKRVPVPDTTEENEGNALRPNGRAEPGG
jgi:hypothetical protein